MNYDKAVKLSAAPILRLSKCRREASGQSVATNCGDRHHRIRQVGRLSIDQPSAPMHPRPRAYLLMVARAKGRAASLLSRPDRTGRQADLAGARARKRPFPCPTYHRIGGRASSRRTSHASRDYRPGLAVAQSHTPQPPKTRRVVRETTRQPPCLRVGKGCAHSPPQRGRVVHEIRGPTLR